MKFLSCVFSWTVAITQRGIEVFFTEEFPEWTDILSRAPVAVTCSKDKRHSAKLYTFYGNYWKYHEGAYQRSAGIFKILSVNK